MLSVCFIPLAGDPPESSQNISLKKDAALMVRRLISPQDLLLASFLTISLSKLLEFKGELSHSSLSCLITLLVEIGLNCGHCLIHLCDKFLHNVDFLNESYCLGSILIFTFMPSTSAVS